MTSTAASLPDFTSDSISASGRTSDKLSLLTLQSKMKRDSEGYTSELNLVYKQFKSSVELFLQQAALNFTSLSGISADSTVAKDLGDRALFLAHVTLFYKKELAGFPNELIRFLESSARNLPSGLRVHVTQALILLINRQVIDIGATLEVFIELQTVGDKNLKELASTHVIKSIKRMNQKHKHDSKNRALQNILFTMLQQEDEAKAVRALKTLCKLHQKRVWFDDRTANAICTACFHPSSRIMQFSLKFLLEFEKIEYDDSDSDSDDEPTPHAQIVLSREAIYKANHKGTTSSKKKKKAKLERVARSMKKQQRKDSKEASSNYYSPLSHLIDAQGFVEKLFSRLQSCTERFDVKLIMIKVIARTIGLHHLILLSFYPYLQKYVQPHQTNVVEILAAAVQACHDMVPPDSIEPLFKQIVNQFVHDRSRPEAISVGLNVVREICLRMPLLMTEDLLQDLVLYRKSNEKAVSSAARSLLSLFREVCPSLLVKKDRGRSANTKAKPKAFGEVHVSSNIPGIELLEQDNGDDEDEDEDEDVDEENDVASIEDDDGVSLIEEDGSGESDGASSDEDIENEISDEDESMFGADDVSDEENSGDDDEELEESSLMETDSNSKSKSKKRKFSEESSLTETDSNNKLKTKKIKFSDFEGQLNVASDSLRALKKLAGETLNVTSNTDDAFLSNEDFQRIKELEAKQNARDIITKHGLKVPNSDQLSMKRVDAAKLQANIRKKLTKEERKAMMRSGREDDDKYRSKTAVKQKKTGGSSNKQKEHKKIMPRAAKQSKINRGRVMKKKQSKHADKQFRGRKAWKN